MNLRTVLSSFRSSVPLQYTLNALNLRCMLYTQAQLYDNEGKTLAPYALKSSGSLGRKYAESEDPYRTPFQRDRDRIIHSKAFRRLSGKTQVFVSSYGDHYRSRLTHSIEVAQVSRDIARSLGLNEDLCETIALAHDLGHTPFGHAGEEAMSEMMAKYNEVFEHNEQSRRIVEHLEKKSDEYPGLNLSFEVIEGMMKHRRFHDDSKTPVIHSLEAQVVDLADAIAYHHHDLDDGLRASVLQYEELSEKVDLWKQAIEDVSFSRLGEDLFRQTIINRVISHLIIDAIENTASILQEKNITAPLAQGNNSYLVSFSPNIQKKVDQLAEFLGGSFYIHEKVSTQALHGQQIIKTLFEWYSKHEKLLPLAVRQQFKTEKRHIVIKDYIAGMTDEFAIKIYEENKELL